MTTQIKAPDIPNPAYPQGGYPSKGRKLGPAWTRMWSLLDKALVPLDGTELAETVAVEMDLAPATLVAVLGRAAKAGLLVKEPKDVKIERGSAARPMRDTTRTRMHYSINRERRDDAA